MKLIALKEVDIKDWSVLKHNHVYHIVTLLNVVIEMTANSKGQLIIDDGTVINGEDSHIYIQKVYKLVEFEV